MPLKCEFGYNNGLGIVVLPTVDTKDGTMSSMHDKSRYNFNRDNIDLKVKFPLNDVDYDGPREINVYA